MLRRRIKYRLWVDASQRPFEPAYERAASSPLLSEQRCHCTAGRSLTRSSLRIRRSIHYGAGKGADERRRIQVNSQPERFHDYSLFIPVVCPCCGVDSERDACLREREEPGLMSMLVVTRLGGGDSPHPGDAFKSAAARQHLT